MWMGGEWGRGGRLGRRSGIRARWLHRPARHPSHRSPDARRGTRSVRPGRRLAWEGLLCGSRRAIPVPEDDGPERRDSAFEPARRRLAPGRSYRERPGHFFPFRCERRSLGRMRFCIKTPARRMIGPTTRKEGVMATGTARGFAVFAGIAPEIIRATAREAEGRGFSSFWVNHPGPVDGL